MHRHNNDFDETVNFIKSFLRFRVWGPILFLIIIVVGLMQSFYIVDPGFEAVQVRLGTVVDSIKRSGVHFKVPFIDEVLRFDVRIRKADIATNSLSKDLQGVSTTMVINYKISDLPSLYQEIGRSYKEIILNPFTQESVKAIVAQYTAEDLIKNRQDAKEKVLEDLKKRLSSKYIILVDFNFTHLGFSTEFIKAVEEKQIAEQSAKKAKNLTEKIKEEALQQITRADAEAYSLKAQREVVSPELIRLREVEAQIKAIDKWNGVLPRITGSYIPMLPIASNDKK